MARGQRVDWQAVCDRDFPVPDHVPLTDATAELTTMLGDPDPALRDGLALPVLGTWVQRGVYDDLLSGLGDGMAVGLTGGLGRTEDDSVFRRSFSSLVLAACIDRDSTRPLVPGGKVLEWGDRVATWLLAERDLRGWVPGRGWAHAVAHGADAVGAVARSPHCSAAELTVLLDVIGERVCTTSGPPLGAGEPDRLADATMEVLRRDRVPFDIVEAWLGRLTDHARDLLDVTDRDPYAATADVVAFLRALHLICSIGPRPPADRADLLLVLIDSLRRLSPELLGAPVPAGA